MAVRRERVWPIHLGLGALLLVAMPFAWHSWSFGVAGLARDLDEPTHLFRAGAWLSNALIFLHMLGGAAITVLAPLQVLPVLRTRAPALHRASGYLLAGLAVLTALAGLAYIPLRGTVGGPWMDVAFAGYGALLLLAAVQAPRMARARDFSAHRAWALRLFVLAMGSLIYRLHYAVWYLATDGLASAPDFSGAFDRVTLFAFYLPYLAALELWLRLRPAPPPQPAGARA